MKNTMLNSLLNLKKNFFDSYNLQSGLLSHLISGDLSETTQVNSSGGYGYTFSPISNGLMTIVQLNPDKTSQTYNIEVDADGVDLDAPLSGEFSDLGSLMEDITESCDCNGCMSQVVSMFTTSTNVDVPSLLGYIDNAYPRGNDTINQIKSCLCANSDGGRISQFKFLNIMKEMLAARNKTEKNGITMDTTSAYYVKNLIGTVLRSVLSSILQIATAVITMINAAIGIIVSVISKVVSAIVGSIKSVAHVGVVVKDFSSITNLFDGCETAAVYKPNFPLLCDVVKANVSKAITFDFGAYSYYIWDSGIDSAYNPTNVGAININAFLSMQLHPQRTMQALADSALAFSKTGGVFDAATVYQVYNPAGAPWDPSSILARSDIYMTQEEHLALMYASQSEINFYAIANKVLTQFFCLSLAAFSSASARYVDYCIPTSWESSITHNNCMDYGVGIALSMICEYASGTSISTIKSQYGTSAAASGLTQMMIESLEHDNSSCTDFSHNARTETHAYTVYKTGMHRIFDMTGDAQNELTMGANYSYEVVDSIPTSRAWSFSTAKWSQVIASIALAIGISAAVVTAYAVGKVQYKKFTTRKQINEFAKVQRARGDYIDKDTGEIKDDPTGELFSSYYKAIKKYNRLGRMFGWGTYDAVNNWNDTSSSGLNSEISSLSQTGAASASSVGALSEDVTTLNSMVTDPDESPILKGIDGLKRSITG